MSKRRSHIKRAKVQRGGGSMTCIRLLSRSAASGLSSNPRKVKRLYARAQALAGYYQDT